MTPLVAQRAERAADGLYRSHHADVYRYALALLNNPADAEDVTQTAFMNAFRALRRGERPRAPRKWLIAIAHNLCRQRFRQSARRPSEVEFDESFAEAASDEEQWSAHDIRRALSHLGFNQRAALVLREVEGRSYAEISDLLGLSLPAVEALVFRARRALREQLEGGLSCAHAERAIALQLAGRLARAERGELRAHLRACQDCATLAKSRRGRSRTLGGLASLLPFPLPFKSLFGGSSGAAAAGGTGSAVAGKAAAVALVALVASGVGYRGFEHLGRGTERHPAGAQAEHDALRERSGLATAGASPGSRLPRPSTRNVVSGGPAATAYRAVPLSHRDVVSGGPAATAYRAMPFWHGGWESHDAQRAPVARGWAPDAGEAAGGPEAAPDQPVPAVEERPHLVAPPATTELPPTAAGTPTEGSSGLAATPASKPGGPPAAAPSASDADAPAAADHAAVPGISAGGNGASAVAVAGKAVASSAQMVPVEAASPEKSEKPKAEKDEKASPEKSEKPKAEKDEKASPEKSEKQTPVKGEQPKSEKNDKREDAKPAPDKGEKPAPANSERRKAEASEKPQAEKNEKPKAEKSEKLASDKTKEASSDKTDKPSAETNETPENDDEISPEKSGGAETAVPAADAPGPVG